MAELLLAARERGFRFWLPFILIGIIAAGFAALPFPFLEKLRVLSAGVCAQRFGHSLLFGGVQPPLEARMIGIYGGFMVTVLTLWALGRGKTILMAPTPLLALALLMIATMGFDGTNALLHDMHVFHLYAPDNRLRLFTGTLSGIGIAMLILPIINYTLWRQGDERPVVPGWRVLGIILLTECAFMAIALTGFGFLLYPISILSVGGIVVLLLAINLMVVLGIMHRESMATRWTQLLMPVALSSSFVIAELLVLASLRFLAESTLGITPL